MGSECTKSVIIARDVSKRGVDKCHLCTIIHVCSCDGEGVKKPRLSADHCEPRK